MRELIWQLRMKGYSMKEIAKGSGIHNTNLSKYLHGAYNANQETEEKLKQFAIRENVYKPDTNT